MVQQTRNELKYRRLQFTGSPQSAFPIPTDNRTNSTPRIEPKELRNVIAKLPQLVGLEFPGISSAITRFSDRRQLGFPIKKYKFSFLAQSQGAS
jgi:hypothetical protein